MIYQKCKTVFLIQNKLRKKRKKKKNLTNYFVKKVRRFKPYFDDLS